MIATARWGVNGDDDIFYRNGPKDGDWKHIDGKLAQIAVGGKHGQFVWGVNAEDDVYCRDGGVGGSWRQVQGKLKQVHCAGDGNVVWGVNGSNDIFRYA